MGFTWFQRWFAPSSAQAGDSRYMELVEQAIVGFLLRRPDGQILMVNDAYCRLTGYTREELLQMKIQQVVSSIDAGVLDRTNALKVGESIWTKAHMLRKDGSDVYIEANTHRLKDGNLQSTVLDITGRQLAETERAESERRYTDLVEQSIFGIVVRRPDRRIVLVNAAFCRITGYSSDELLQMATTNELLRPQGRVLSDRADALKPGESMRVESELRRKDGSHVPIEATTLRLLNGNLQSTVVDITERRRAELAREESEKRYAELVDQALEGITVRKPDGAYVFVNDTFCRMFGYTRAELLHMGIRDLVHPEDLETVEQVERLNSGRNLHVAKRMRHKDGHTVHVEVSVRRLHDGNFQSTIQDVSESKRSEQRFRTMVEGAPNAMIMVDEQGKIVLVNPQTTKLFGYGGAELMGQPIEMLVPERFRRQHPGLRGGYQRAPQMRSMGRGRDLYGLRKDGGEVPVEIGLNPITTREGSFVLASIIDISQRREAEEREQAYMEELRLMSQRLLQAQEDERRAIARELHDEVGQALTATGMLLRDLEQQAGDGPLSTLAMEASGLVTGLLKQVRQLSLNLHPSVLDDLGLTAALRWAVRTRSGGSDLQVTLELAEDLPRFAPMIENTAFRVFQECLSNVQRHAAARAMRVTLARNGDALEMVVEDDGRGFEPAAAGKHAQEGKSLGVLGMRERVRLAGGRIDLESSPGAGTRVRVWLPAMERTHRSGQA